MARDRSRFNIERGEPLSADRAGRRTGATPATPAKPGAPTDGIVRVSRQTQGRKGKGVTLITGLRMPPDALAALCKQLKQRCGAGGTSKDGVIEIQGDHRDVLVTELEALGHTVKRAGG